MPRCGGDFGHRELHRISQRLFDVLQFLNGYSGMISRLLEGQPQPEAVPDDAHRSVEVKGGLPADPLGQNSRHWHSNNDSSI